VVKVQVGLRTRIFLHIPLHYPKKHVYLSQEKAVLIEQEYANMIGEENTLSGYPQYPANDNPDLWQAYSDEWIAYHERYKAQFSRIEDMPGWNAYRDSWRNYWLRQQKIERSEPLISTTRQDFLKQRYAVKSDIQRGIYPFKFDDKSMKLTRADIEWLIDFHKGDHNQTKRIDNIDEQEEPQGLDFRGADLDELDLSNLSLDCILGGLRRSEWLRATIEQREAAIIHMERCRLEETSLKQAYLREARLDGAFLRNAHLEYAALRYAHFEGAYLKYAYLEGANLGGAYFDNATRLNHVRLSDKHKRNAPQLDGIHWGEADLSVVNWSEMKKTGDEDVARALKSNEKDEILNAYRKAARSSQQLAIALQNQGLDREASNFFYRTKMLQRTIMWREKRYPSYLFSWLLNLSAGYGYRPIRFIFATVVILLLFWAAYYILALTTGTHTTLLSALALSIQNFFTPDFKLQDGTVQAFFSAFEGLCGLFIAAILIAIVTQRILGK
jgi:uncharacterized protein YjbI with pentapeptide repeats